MIKLEKINCDLEIVELDDQDGLVLNKKNNDLKITVYDNDLIIKIIDHNFNKKYRSLLYMIMSLDSTDTTESDTELALLKIDDLRNLLIKKYFKFLSNGIIDKYLNMLFLLEEKIPIINKDRGR